MDFKNMLNRPLLGVSLNKEKDLITFEFKDGFKRSFSVEGDCCSHSWIEHLEAPATLDLDGAIIHKVEDSAPVTQDHPEHDEENGGACINVYNTVFATSAGEIVLEYRNSSNGYYGGYLVDSEEHV